MMLMVLAFIVGKIASINIKTPMPPSQWVKLLQNKILFGNDSISFRTVAPVVLNPDAHSNTASIKRGIEPLITNGIAPNKDTLIQLSATMAKPSRV